MLDCLPKCQPICFPPVIFFSVLFELSVIKSDCFIVSMSSRELWNMKKKKEKKRQQLEFNWKNMMIMVTFFMVLLRVVWRRCAGSVQVLLGARGARDAHAAVLRPLCWDPMKAIKHDREKNSVSWMTHDPHFIDPAGNVGLSAKHTEWSQIGNDTWNQPASTAGPVLPTATETFSM